MAQEYSQFLLGINPLIQGLEHNHELLGIQSGVEMLGVPSKRQGSHFMKNFVHRNLPESSNGNFGMGSAVSTWPVDDSSSISLFNCQEGEQLDRKLSLSHFSVKSPDGIGLPDSLQQQQQQLFVHARREHYLKKSKYLKPTQELLSEFCNIQEGHNSKEGPKQGSRREEGDPSSWQQSLYSMNHLELHKLKAKLFSMLEEVDRTYRKYCEQMKAVVSSFETMAGEGAADIYSTLASKAMSRHFRRLKDGIVDQINAVKKAMGETDPSAPGGTRAETPRLKLLDQCIRQQKALQHGMVQQLPWRPQRGLPERSVSILRAWLFEHFLHPYPSDVDKVILARKAGLSRSQVSNWFINARVRIWKPMVEEMYSEEMKELDAKSNQNPNPNSALSLVHKPFLNDSESLSSIINSSHHGVHQPQQQRVSGADHFGVVDYDVFSSYGNFASDDLRRSVSLTLGLQQHNGGGMSLSFSAASQQPLHHGRQGELSMLDGEAQGVPRRNLMGTQLLHDLAG
ncbi:homeobox protein BEL1 homolog [Musa acuminata AAA Group]|uniref:homeobox protein BEL1 homolog n=1 Tax=Musa acuminata AAA Group TaxID=214697 RepID=UPI0031DA197C